MITAFPKTTAAKTDELATNALRLAALGSETRLSLFRLLVVAGNEGMYTGAISEKLGLAGSTLNHHLATLETAGLIKRLREGRNIRCQVLASEMHGLVDYLTRNCCCHIHQSRQECRNHASYPGEDKGDSHV